MRQDRQDRENSLDSDRIWTKKVLDGLNVLNRDRNPTMVQRAVDQAYLRDIFRDAGVTDPNKRIRTILTKAAQNRKLSEDPKYKDIKDEAMRISQAIAEGYLTERDIASAYQEDEQGYSPKI